MNVRTIVPLVSDISECHLDYIAQIGGKYLDAKNNITMYEDHKRFDAPFFPEGSSLEDHYHSLCEFLVCFGFLNADELRMILGSQLLNNWDPIPQGTVIWTVIDTSDKDHHFCFKKPTVDLREQPKHLLIMATLSLT